MMLAPVVGILERAVLSQGLQHISFCAGSELLCCTKMWCVCVESKDGMSCPHMRVVGGGGDVNAV